MAGVARKPLVAGNWKMNGTSASLEEARKIAEGAQSFAASVDVMICPPSTLLSRIDLRCAGTDLLLGGQDCHEHQSGAHTGDVSASMLADAGASAVILGHSERRADHGETSQIVANKASAVHDAEMLAIVCTGESDIERKWGQATTVVAEQLRHSLPKTVSGHNTVIAYEPVWAIGTGLTPTADDVAEMHGFIRNVISDQFGPSIAAAIRIIYGGSVKPGNAGQLLKVDDVDGALVGGASLKARDFLAILGAYAPKQEKLPARAARDAADNDDASDVEEPEAKPAPVKAEDSTATETSKSKKTAAVAGKKPA